ncbi:FIG146085: 3'-to-5' oligoribonuclease A, Bacillus type [hydrothermal vent metagenome]|uniref:FIG146085: 3'-to-5' oligoribonuclease A, Bacillus type n=1 Tax=hydrothermal vent metagenome TaxID=652676 RepID=A0A1W1BML9_9ZZZZ
MQINIEKITNAQHILIVADSAAFANASALYSCILTLHKKVSLQNSEPLNVNLSFLPWFDKSRLHRPSTADYIIEVDSDTLELYKFFIKNTFKINQKMATALYAGLLDRYDNFKSDECDGTIFTLISTLLGLKANKKICHEFLLQRVPLAYMRLKERLLKSLILKDEARHAFVSICDDDLKSSNTELIDAYKIMKEFLTIVHVEKVTLLKSDENNKIIKEI